MMWRDGKGGGKYYYFMQVKSNIRADLYNLWLGKSLLYPSADSKDKTKQSDQDVLYENCYICFGSLLSISDYD